MKKALLVLAVLAIAATASAGNLPIGDAIPWNAPWGPAATVTDLGGNVVKIAVSNGSAGLFWRLPAVASEEVQITGTWEGNVDNVGWAEVMFFTSTAGQDNATVAGRIDVGNAADIAAKHDDWGLNGGPIWGPEPIENALHPDGPGTIIHATCDEVIVAIKIGQSGGGTANWATYDLTYIPEPASALLLLGGLPLLLRRRR